MIRWQWRTGTVDYASLPPSVTVEGYPALPGEGHIAYRDRIARAFGVPMRHPPSHVRPAP